jgi:integrase/recombinase XerD
MASRLWVPVASGPLAPYASGYGSWLAARGYSRWTVSRRLWQLDLLSRWLEREGLSPGELSPERVEGFLVARRAAGYSTWLSVRGTALPLEYLRELGVVPAVTALGVTGDPVGRLLAEYSRYLFDERALSEHTVLVRYVPVARLFLDGVMGAEGLELERLTAAGVSSFLARECRRRSVPGARELVVALRSFLRYLHVAGLIAMPLQWAVPSVADLRDRSLPRGLEPAVVKRLLSSCDRRRTVGRRDYAVLLLVSRLGLRAGEVAALRLVDIDWRAGEIMVRGKGSRHERLPLPADVGDAVAGWLERGRPRRDSPFVFTRLRAPYVGLTSGAVSQLVRRVSVRAGLAPVGAHRLRHTAATEMLRAGGSLTEVGQVLRHRGRDVTSIYAKVDRLALAQVVQPWPGAQA